MAGRLIRPLLRAGSMVLVLGLLVAGVEAARQAYDGSLRNVAFFDGWMLFGLTAFLSAFAIGKRLQALPLLPRASVGQTVHVIVGSLACAVFVLHAGGLPDGGWFHGLLWLVFALVAVSGIVGELLSRILPRRLREDPYSFLCRSEAWPVLATTDPQQGAVDRRRPVERRRHVERVPLERIAEFRRRVVTVAEAMIESEANQPTLVEFATRRLMAFLHQRPAILSHLLRSNRAMRHLTNMLRYEEYFLDDRGRATMRKLETLAQAKNSLDYQYAHHVALRAWLYVHVPLTSGLILMAAAHIVVVHGFAGGEP